jgi:hypothetical protein
MVEPMISKATKMRSSTCKYGIFNEQSIRKHASIGIDTYRCRPECRQKHTNQMNGDEGKLCFSTVQSRMILPLFIVDMRCVHDLPAEFQFARHVRLPMGTIESKIRTYTCPKHEPWIYTQLH